MDSPVPSCDRRVESALRGRLQHPGSLSPSLTHFIIAIAYIPSVLFNRGSLQLAFISLSFLLLPGLCKLVEFRRHFYPLFLLDAPPSLSIPPCSSLLTYFGSPKFAAHHPPPPPLSLTLAHTARPWRVRGRRREWGEGQGLGRRDWHAGHGGTLGGHHYHRRLYLPLVMLMGRSAVQERSCR